jgi:hypothetical protein
MPDSRLLPLPRRPSLSPVEWTLGHVAFTFEMMYGRTLSHPEPCFHAIAVCDLVRVAAAEHPRAC